MPNGQRREVEIDRPEEVERVAELLIESGARFEIEMLSNYRTISMTCESEVENEDDGTLAHELVENGPAIPEAVDRLVATAFRKLQEQEGE
jgi:hypothetical protein